MKFRFNSLVLCSTTARIYVSEHISDFAYRSVVDEILPANTDNTPKAMGRAAYLQVRANGSSI